MNRAIMAARAAAPTPNHGTPGTSLLDRRDPAKPLRTTGKNRKCKKSTPVQRNSEGRPSEWARSAHYWTDAKWSRTVSDG